MLPQSLPRSERLIPLSSGRAFESEDGLDSSTLLERLDALRRTIVIALSSLALTFVVCFTFSDTVVRTLLRPVRDSLPDGAVLAAMRIPEVFLLHMKASLLLALVLVSPLWLYQLTRFLSSIVPKRDSMAFAPVAFVGTTLFAVGAGFGHFVLFPQGVRFLTAFGSDTVHVVLSVEAAFSIYSRFVLGVGAAFQVPTVVYVLSWLGWVTPTSLIRLWKAVILGAFTLAAVVTPTPDVVTQSLLALPLIVLYALSIGVCWAVRLYRR
jgi:sec-independent protein translocase protein TatC